MLRGSLSRLIIVLCNGKDLATLALGSPTMLVITVFMACAGTALGQVRTLPLSINADDTNIGAPLDGFVSYSIEFSSFPDYAGMLLPVWRTMYTIILTDQR